MSNTKLSFCHNTNDPNQLDEFSEDETDMSLEKSSHQTRRRGNSPKIYRSFHRPIALQLLSTSCNPLLSLPSYPHYFPSNRSSLPPSIAVWVLWPKIYIMSPVKRFLCNCCIAFCGLFYNIMGHCFFPSSRDPSHPPYIVDQIIYAPDKKPFPLHILYTLLGLGFFYDFFRFSDVLLCLLLLSG